MLSQQQITKDHQDRGQGKEEDQVTFTISRLSREEARSHFFKWAISEQWNPTEGAALDGTDGDIDKIYYNIDNEGFFAGKVSSPQAPEPRIVSIISGLRYSPQQAYIGYYIVDPAERGRGYGLKTFRYALDSLRKGSLGDGNNDTPVSVGLDGVMAQTDNYRKSGFTQVVWRNERRHGSDLRRLVDEQEHGLATRLRAGEEPSVVDIETLFGPESKLSDDEIEALYAQLAAMDTKYTGLQRPGFYKDWVQFHAAHGGAANASKKVTTNSSSTSSSDESLNTIRQHRFGVAVLAEPTTTDNKVPTILGIGFVRPAQSSYRVGPLYAPRQEIAKKILVRLALRVLDASSSSSTPLKFDVDVPVENKPAAELFDSLGWNDTFPCLRMWNGPVPPHDISGIYGVTTLEVG
ncbi:hypothetical protein BGZ94_002829 [Podila epigama]|nr:hypothetical protein BGZ94_002829 [Podila epigama]